MPPPMEEPKKFSIREQITLIKAFSRYYLPHKKLLYLDIAVIVASPVFTMALPLLVFQTLNEYLPQKNKEMIAWALAGILFLSLMVAVTDYIATRWGHILGVRMEADMRGDLFRHIQSLSFTYFDRTKTGHIMSRISNDLTMIAEVAHHSPEDLISATLMLIGGFGVMLWINPLLTLMTVLPLPLIILWGSVFQGRMRRGFRQVRKDVAEINSQVENSIQGVREVKSYTNEEYEIGKFDSVNRNFRVTRENVCGILALFHSGMMFLIQTYSLIFIIIGIVLIYLGRANLPEIITFFMYSKYITMPVFRLVGFVEQYQQGMTAFERFHEIMLEAPEIMDRPGALSSLPKPLRGEITFENVCFRYPIEVKKEEEKENGASLSSSAAADTAKNSSSSDWVLDHITMKVPAGKTLALVGESGAGKTTMAALIPRFYEVNEGRVAIDGINVRDFEQKFLRSCVGIVQQTPFLFDSTIRENILFGRPDATQEEIENAARDANIYDFIMSMPDGFDSVCGERGVKLSGGQKQRISIARVFLKNPPILIFDEATSALDNQSEALVQDSMERLCSGRTTIIIAHRLSTVRNADTICCLRGGKIVEAGTHKELLALGGYYKELYSMHSF